MIVALLALDTLWLLVLATVWPWAGLTVGRLPLAPSHAALRRRSAYALVLITLATGATALRVATSAALAGYGWWFAQEKVVLALPLLVVPATLTLAGTAPRLVRLRREARLAAEPPSQPLRQQAAHPKLATPVQAAGFAALAGLVVAFGISYPATPLASTILITLTGAGAWLTWLRHSARHRRLADPASKVAPHLLLRMVRATAIASAAVVVLTGVAVGVGLTSRVPERINMGAHTAVDLGGGRPVEHGSTTAAGHGHGRPATETSTGVSIADLRGPAATEPGQRRRFTLTARHATVRLPSGATVDALTYDGSIPGPHLEASEGDIIEVTLRNTDITDGVTIHWHGYDVPNREDGVAGLTQDAVKPGQEFTYRFRADQVGSYWYHSHQASNEQVQAGLFGTLVVQPRDEKPADIDLTLPAHAFGNRNEPHTLGPSDLEQRQKVQPGRTVKLRLINTNSRSETFRLYGIAAKLAAVDGTDLNQPADVVNPSVETPAGGRYDLTFTMPDGPVLLDVDETGGLLLSPDGGQAKPPTDTSTSIDPLSYGQPAQTPINPNTDFDRRFTLVLDQKLSFRGGTPNFIYSVNGRAFPDIPTPLVKAGETVKFIVVNRGFDNHPMHPHGHHVLVLSRNGKPVTGSPLWMDTFNVGPGEVWEVALKTDNPGIWMDHCHNLLHASAGMMFHLAYEGVSTPFEIGKATPNHPE